MPHVVVGMVVILLSGDLPSTLLHATQRHIMDMGMATVLVMVMVLDMGITVMAIQTLEATMAVRIITRTTTVVDTTILEVQVVQAVDLVKVDLRVREL